VGVFLESIADWEAFLAQANALAAIKPLVLTKLGRTMAGNRASFAHLGIPDGADMKELEAGSNVIIAQTGLEMLNIAKALSWQPIPRGRRVGILTGSGGIGAELSDLCAEQGLEVPEFSGKLQTTLRHYLPSYASVQNPVDLTPIWWEFPRVYPPLMKALLASAEIDLLIVAVLDVATTIDALMAAITKTVRQLPPDDGSLKPLYVYWASRNSMMKNMAILEETHIPCYRSTLETIRVAKAISRYGANSSKSEY
jgi:acetyltransferase